MKTIHRSENCVIAMIAMLLGCGGSGSTGLITLESVLFDDVRSSNECLDANDTVYCPGLPGEFPPPEMDEDGIPKICIAAVQGLPPLLTLIPTQP